MDKKTLFLVINALVIFIALGIMLGAFVYDDKQTRINIMLVAVGILIMQKLVEAIIIKETRKISIAILITLVALVAYYFGYIR